MATILSLDPADPPTDGDTLVYDAATKKWRPGPQSGGGGSSLVTVNAQAGAYSLVVADGGKAVEVTSATPVTVTVPTNAAQALPIGSVIEIMQVGAGQVTIAFASGVTFKSRGDLVDLAGQNAVATLRKRATNDWSLAGDLS